MKGCTAPKTGWDVIFKPENGIYVPECGKVKTIYVEMKNKHNTMNSQSSGRTYIKMQAKLLEDDDCACFLVEAIAKKSQNAAWTVSIDGTKQKHRRIRRVSMDEFYYTVTGEKDAFYKMCMVLPQVIEDVIENVDEIKSPNDTVIEELNAIAKNKKGSFTLALYMLGFNTYNGFNS